MPQGKGRVSVLSVLPRVWKVDYNDEEVGKLAVSVLLLIFFGFFPYVIIRTEKNSLKLFKIRFI